MKKDRAVYLKHLGGCIARIKLYTDAGKEHFLNDLKTQDAVIRNIEIIGQVVRDLGIDDLATRYPETPWRAIAGTRNFLAHQYLGVDPVLIWNIVAGDLPLLEQQLASLLAEIETRG